MSRRFQRAGLIFDRLKNKCCAQNVKQAIPFYENVNKDMQGVSHLKFNSFQVKVK
jgi:hypothetical protein